MGSAKIGMTPARYHLVKLRLVKMLFCAKQSCQRIYIALVIFIICCNRRGRQFNAKRIRKFRPLKYPCFIKGKTERKGLSMPRG